MSCVVKTSCAPLGLCAGSLKSLRIARASMAKVQAGLELVLPQSRPLGAEDPDEEARGDAEQGDRSPRRIPRRGAARRAQGRSSCARRWILEALAQRRPRRPGRAEAGRRVPATLDAQILHPDVRRAHEGSGRECRVLVRDRRSSHRENSESCSRQDARWSASIWRSPHPRAPGPALVSRPGGAEPGEDRGERGVVVLGRQQERKRLLGRVRAHGWSRSRRAGACRSRTRRPPG